MSSITSNYNNIINARYYFKDSSAQIHLAKRVAIASLPILNLIPPLRYSTTVAMSGLRVLKTDINKDPIGTAIAIAVLVASIFQHRIGLVLKTTYDTFIEIKKIPNAKNKEGVAKSLLKVFSNLIYLTLLAHGGLELSILSLALKAVINLIQACDEFKSDQWIEGTANLLMVVIRLYKTQAGIKEFYIR